jgi:hypothetical protein
MRDKRHHGHGDRSSRGGDTAARNTSLAAGAGKDDRFSAPAISLPKGGGAIKGIGEKFAANPITGRKAHDSFATQSRTVWIYSRACTRL